LTEKYRLVRLSLQEWSARRRQRADLADLDARLLRDIGLTRAEVIAECAKPFWSR
jgi:uncharacterized protein YjiS (DUF1127 family)